MPSSDNPQIPQENLDTRKKDSNIEADYHRLGWLQTSILTLLWSRQMYGLEIQKHLQLQGHNVSPSQLYPALKRLTDNKLCEKYEKKYSGGERIFYKTTKLGQTLIQKYIADLLENLFMIVGGELAFIADKVITLLGENLVGKVIVDFSSTQIEEVLVTLAKSTIHQADNNEDSEAKGNFVPTGRFFISSPSKDHTDLLKERLDHYEISHIVSILEIQYQPQLNLDKTLEIPLLKGPLLEKNNENTIKRLPLPEKSVDIAFVFFTLHEDNTEWIVRCISRILKTNGKAIIVDYIAEGQTMLERTLSKFTYAHTSFTINEQKLKKLLTASTNPQKLKIIKEEVNQGLAFYVVTPEAPSKKSSAK